jgi:hypothetical protein
MMFRCVARLAVCVVALVFLLDTARAQEARKPDIADVQILGVLLVPSDGKVRIAVRLANSTDSPIWANVSVEAPGQVQCGGGKVPIAPRERMIVACGNDEIAADHDYPVSAAIYLDDKLTEVLGTVAGKGRFAQADIATLQAQLKPPAFPVSMKNVVHSETASAIAAMSTTVGTLALDEGGLKYTDKDKTIEIPSAQMQSIRPRIDRQHWMITVEYQDGAEKKTAVFQRSYFSGSHEGLNDFMRGLIFVFNNRKR